jgi:L-ribulose-5-phosphate 4-epimerase
MILKHLFLALLFGISTILELFMEEIERKALMKKEVLYPARCMVRKTRRSPMGKTAYETYKQDVLNASLWLSGHGYFGSLRGTGGNVSVRVRGESSMAITPSGARYQELSSRDICIVGLDLAVIEGNERLKPSVESGIHSVIYRKRPDVNAVVHTHQLYGSVFAVLGEPIPALFDEVSFSLGGTVEVVSYALSGSPDLVQNVEEKLSNNANAYLMQNHGILALGKDLEQAILHAELLEKVAQVYSLALSTGRTIHTLPGAIVEMVQAVRSHEVSEAGMTRGEKG